MARPHPGPAEPASVHLGRAWRALSRLTPRHGPAGSVLGGGPSSMASRHSSSAASGPRTARIPAVTSSASTRPNCGRAGSIRPGATNGQQHQRPAVRACPIGRPVHANAGRQRPNGTQDPSSTPTRRRRHRAATSPLRGKRCAVRLVR
jgi:hypothetical protein